MSHSKKTPLDKAAVEFILSVLTALNEKNLSFLVDAVLWALLLPLVTIPAVFFFILKRLVVEPAAAFLRQDLKPISNNDVAVARNNVDVKSIVDIGFVIKVDSTTRVSIHQLRETFSRLFLQKNKNGDDPYRSLRCNFDIFCGYLFTKEVAQVPTHLLIYEDTLLNKESAAEYFSRWYHCAYRDDSLPRWEMVLIPPSPQDESTYIGFRMHHGLIDGFGMIHFLDKLCDDVQSPYLVPPPSHPPNILYKLSLLGKYPRLLLETWLKSRKEEWALPLLKETPPEMFISWGTFDVEKLKRVRRGLGLSFNTLLYTLQTGALRRLLENTGRGELVTPCLPVFHTIPKPNHPRTTFTNHWSFVKFQSPFEEKDPLVRAAQTETLYDNFINSELNVSAEMFFLGFANIIPTWISDKILDLNTQLTAYKASCSSMVRSPTQYKLFGIHPLQNIFHTFCTKDLCSETVLYMNTASHNKQIDITFTAAPELVQHSHKLMDDLINVHFRNELDLLDQLTTPKTF